MLRIDKSGSSPGRDGERRIAKRDEGLLKKIAC
jgi:hypothetical protein